MNENVHKNIHAKIMKEMISYLDLCKMEKMDCNCTCLLEYNSFEIDEDKKYKFIYQCSSNDNANETVKNLTNNLLKNIKLPKIETYK